MDKEVTIYDLAEYLDLSPSTVSRALNDHPAVNEKTKERVNKAATRYGYQLNRFAKNLRAKSTNTIGIMVPKLDSYFLAMVLASMERIANKSGFNLIITQSFESQDKEEANANTLYNSRVDGLLVSSVSDATASHFEKFFKKKIPIIFFDRVPEINKATRVVIDNFQAGYMATKHLIDIGRTNIWHVTGDQKWNVYRDRYQGYKKALEEHGLDFSDNMLHLTDLHIKSSEKIVDLIHKSNKKPDGLFVTNDTFAASILVKLKHLGYAIPEDIAIIGFNNDPITQVVEPKLSTIYYHAEELGEVAAQSLIDHLLGKSDIHCTNTITLNFELLVRGSSVRE